MFRQRVRDTLIYGITALGSLICTFFIWPVSYFHIFKGYRGTGAFAQFTDASKWTDRFITHLGFLNKMVFGGLLPVFAIILAGGVFLIIRRCHYIRRTENKPVMDVLSVSTKAFILILISDMLNYIVLTQIALIDGVTCIRQYYTAYALFLVLIPVGSYRFLKATKIPERAAVPITAIMVCVLLVLGHVQKNVLYLYESGKLAKDYAVEHPDSKVVVFQKDDGMYDGLIQDIILYPRVFFASVNDPATARNSEIATAEELLVYLPKNTEEQCFESIVGQNPGLQYRDHLWDSGGFSAYLVHR